MDSALKNYLKKLKEYGRENNIPNVTDAVGQFLNIMIKTKAPKHVLEIGCANGYSTIWIADAVKKTGGHLHTVDHSAPTFADAQKNLNEAGLSESVTFYFGDAREVIPDFSMDLKFDFVFVDGQKASYLDFWNVVKNRLNPEAILVFDDMLAFEPKTRSFSKAIENLEGFDQLLIPIDENDGILLMRKD